MVDQTIGTHGHAPAVQQAAERGGIRDAMLVAGGIAFAASLGFSMITGRIPELYAERDAIAPYMGQQSIDQSEIVASDGGNAIFGWNLWADAQPLEIRRIVFESLSGPVPSVVEFLGFLQHELAEQAHIDLASVSELFSDAGAFALSVAPINGIYPAMPFSPGGGGGWTMGEGAAPVFFQWPSWLPVPSWLMPWVQQQSAAAWLPPGPPPATGMVVQSGPVTPYSPAHAAPPVTVAPAAPVAAPQPSAPAPEPVHYEPIVAAPEPAPVVIEPAPAAPPTVDVPVSNVVIDLGTTAPSTPEAPPSSSAPEPVVAAPQEPSGGDTSGGGFGNDGSSGNDSGGIGGDDNAGGNSGNDNSNDSSGNGPSGSDGGQGNGGSNNSGSDGGSGSNDSGNDDSGNGNSGNGNGNGNGDGNSGSNNDSNSGGDGGGGSTGV